MTRTRRNLRLFFVLLLIIACLYGGFLWFARSTQVETARLHAEVERRLEARGLGPLIEIEPQAPAHLDASVAPVSMEVQEIEALLDEFRELWQSDVWPDYGVDNVIPCDCPEDDEQADPKGAAAFVRGEEQAIVRFLDLANRADFGGFVAAQDPIWSYSGWGTPAREGCELALASAYLAIQDKDYHTAAVRIDTVVYLAEQLAGAPLYDFATARADTFLFLLRLSNAVNLVEVLPSEFADRLLMASAAAATASDLAPITLMDAWRATERVDLLVEGFARYGVEQEEDGPVPSTILRWWTRSYGAFNPWTHLDTDTYVSTILSLSELLERPYFEIIAEPENPLGKLQNPPKMRLLTKEFAGPFVNGYPLIQARWQAICRILMLGLLVQRYHAENGVVPDDLEGLRWPEDVDERARATIQTDPFTGRPLRYIKEKDSCHINSQKLDVFYRCNCKKSFHFGGAQRRAGSE